MNFFSRLFLISTLFFFSNYTKAQNKNYYRSPLNIPLNLAGSFGEIRPNHYHSGIDIKTNQREGLPIFAVADGYVSRLRVQIAGFGNAVYITHPNGTTSVYAHLREFNPVITKFVRYNQYQNKSFEADFNLIPIEIPVKKGDIIAYSGNTGGSMAPHLHFEIRDTNTEETINPLTYNFGVIDDIKPIINSITVYQLNEMPFSYLTPKSTYAVNGNNGNYYISNTINTQNEFGIGIQTFDMMTGNNNKNGIYSIDLIIDDSLITQIEFDKFKFSDTRTINSYVDYHEQLTYKRNIQKTFKSLGNFIDIFKHNVNGGRIKFDDVKIHKAKFVVSDIKGNKSVVHFQLQNSKSDISRNFIATNLLPFNQDYNFEDNEFKIIIPKNSLFEDSEVIIHKMPKTSATQLSSKIIIGNKFTALNTPFNLWIKIDSNYIDKDKTVILNQNGVYQGGILDGNFVKSTIKNFGTYSIGLDKTPPVIKALNEQLNHSKSSKLNFKITDNLSGIKSFNAYVDNQWILMEYDYKKNFLWHTFDEITSFGKHNFKLVVTDWKDNISVYETTFYR